MGKISFVIVHGIGDEKPGEITNKWLSKISPSVLKKLNKREREAFKALEDLPKSEFQNIGIGSVSLVEPRWERREPGSFSINWKILLYVLPLVFFNITSFVSSRENQLKILSDDTVSGLENLRVKYATLWLLCCLPAIIYGFYLVFGLLWCLFVLSLIAVIFCGLTIAKKFNPFLLIGQIKSAALARSSFSLVELVRIEIEKSIKCSDKVIVIAHSQGGVSGMESLERYRGSKFWRFIIR